MLLRLVLLFALFYTTQSSAGLVDELSRSELCGRALQQTFSAQNEVPSCHTLRTYFQIIDANPSYRSFERAKALWESQILINKLSGSLDISNIQSTLNKAFSQNINSLQKKGLHNVSLLAAYNTNNGLKSSEWLFFIGVQKLSNHLYFVEARKQDSYVTFEGFAISELNNTSNRYDQLKLVNSRQTHSLSSIRNLNLQGQEDSVILNSYFLISNYKIRLPRPSLYSSKENTYSAYKKALENFANELCFYIDNRACSSKATSHNFPQKEPSYKSAFRGEKESKYKTSNKVSLREDATTMNSKRISRLSKGTVVYVTDEKIVKEDGQCRNFVWSKIYLERDPQQTGWVCKYYLTPES